MRTWVQIPTTQIKARCCGCNLCTKEAETKTSLQLTDQLDKWNHKLQDQKETLSQSMSASIEEGTQQQPLAFIGILLTHATVQTYTCVGASMCTHKHKFIHKWRGKKKKGRKERERNKERGKKRKRNLWGYEIGSVSMLESCVVFCPQVRLGFVNVKIAAGGLRCRLTCTPFLWILSTCKRWGCVSVLPHTRDVALSPQVSRKVY